MGSIYFIPSILKPFHYWYTSRASYSFSFFLLQLARSISYPTLSCFSIQLISLFGNFVTFFSILSLPLSPLSKSLTLFFRLIYDFMYIHSYRYADRHSYSNESGRNLICIPSIYHLSGIGPLTPVKDVSKEERRVAESSW